MLINANMSGEFPINFKVNRYIYDRQHGLIYLSCFGYDSTMKLLQKGFRKNNSFYVGNTYVYTDPATHKIICNKVPSCDYSNLIFYRKDCSNYNSTAFCFFERETNYSINNDIENITMGSCPQFLVDIFFDKIYKNSEVPIIKEWIPYIVQKLYDRNDIDVPSTNRASDEAKTKIFCISINVRDRVLIDIIRDGLTNHEISIGGCTETSNFMLNVKGIDSYLNEFNEVLTEKIQSNFRPMFTPEPGVNNYEDELNAVSDYIKWNDNIELYNAQKDIAQAISNSFNHRKSIFITGECGSGKTTMAIASIMTHFGELTKKKKKHMNNIIMCPSHLTDTWFREISNRAPRSKAIVINNFFDLMKIVDDLYNQKSRTEHYWIIMSSEAAKFSYDLRPAGVWSKTAKVYRTGEHPWEKEYYHGAFVCPECGQPLKYEKSRGEGRYRNKVTAFAGKDFFRTMSIKANNIVCDNDVVVWDNKRKVKVTKKCGCKLWVPATKDTVYDGTPEHKNRWIKLGKAGWFMRNHLDNIKQEIMNKPTNNADDAMVLTAINNEIDRGTVQKVPYRYSISKFIRQHLKGVIDYVVLDEIHELKGKDSLRAESFGDLVFVAKHLLGLTGTLLNGYSSGIYHILFRMFGKKMKQEGYSFGTSSQFAKDYGVIRNSRDYVTYQGKPSWADGNTKTKELPGVSPIVFPKFLLENSAFINLDDIAEALPGYEEIPVPIDMPEDLERGYKQLETGVHNLLAANGRPARLMSSLVQLLTYYPDQPYDQSPVYDMETGQVLLTPPNLEKEIRAKEQVLLNIVSNKVDEGEHVLIYYAWTNKTDTAEKLGLLFKNNNISYAVLDSSVQSSKREEWINNKVTEGIKVIICNPRLIETGLTLLDFTTIIFYQTGYNLFTMRQASRRSWRINQDHDVQVYFLYYANTVQEQALSLMAAKLQAAMAIEGKFNEEGLSAMSNNDDIINQIANSVTEGIKQTVNIQVFQKNRIVSHKEKVKTERVKETFEMENAYDLIRVNNKKKKKSKPINFLSQDTIDYLNSLR